MMHADNIAQSVETWVVNWNFLSWILTEPLSQNSIDRYLFFRFDCVAGKLVIRWSTSIFDSHAAAITRISQSLYRRRNFTTLLVIVLPTIF